MSSPLDNLAPPAANPLDSLPPPPRTNPLGSIADAAQGPVEALASGVANLPGAAINGAVDLYHRVTGAGGGLPGPVPTVPTGAEGRAFIGRIKDSEAARSVGNVLDSADTSLGKFSPTLQDVVHQAGGVAGDVAALAPAAGAVKAGVGAIGGALDEAAAARAIVPGGPPNPLQELQKVGYKFRPSDVQARNPTMQSVPGSFKESLTSSPEQTQQIVRDNSALSTKLIGEDIGVPNATKLTAQHYANARLAPGADYDRVGAAVGTMTDPNPDVIAQLRSMATDNSAQAAPAQVRAQMGRIADGLESGTYTGPQAIQDISYLRTKGAYDASGALEDELGSQVQAKAPQLQDTYENARTLFAKIKNAEDSTTGGLIDAADYKRLAEAEPRLLTGNSRLVAQAGGELSGVTKLPTPTAAAAPPTESTLFGTSMALARRGIKNVPGMDITSPRMQARIAAAAPDTGPIPTGPPQRGLPSVGQQDLPVGPGGSPAALTPPEGPVPPRSPVRGPLGDQLSMQGPNADLTPPEGVVSPGATPPRPTLDLQQSPGTALGPFQRELPLPPKKRGRLLGNVLGSVDDVAAAGQSQRGARRAPDDHGE